jgi:spermidine/putrescine-binding protein
VRLATEKNQSVSLEVCHRQPLNSRMWKCSSLVHWFFRAMGFLFLTSHFFGYLEAFGQGTSTDPTPRTEKTLSRRTTPIGLLAPLGFLNLATIRQFELKEGVRVKVDFLTSGSEIETRVKSNPFAWDIIVADLSKLQQLQDMKLIQSLETHLGSQNSQLQSSMKQLEQFSWSKHIVPLTLDSLGVVWNEKKLQISEQDLTFSWLLGAGSLSQLKGRLYYNGPKELVFLLGLLEKGALFKSKEVRTRDNLEMQFPKVSELSAESYLAAQAWGAKFLEVKFPTDETLASSLLKGKALYSILWASEFARIHGLFPQLKFAVPQNQSLYEIHGAALTMESRHPQIALQLINVLAENRKLLAERSHTKAFQLEHATETELKGRLISGLVPVSKDLIQRYLSGPAFAD